MPPRAPIAAAQAGPPDDGEETGDLTPSQPPTSGFEDGEDEEVPVTPDEAEGLLGGVSSRLERLETDTGLRFGVAFTTLFQKASGAGDNRDAAGGDLDLLLRWNLIGRGTKNPGTLIFNNEYRFQIGDRTPSELGREIGTGIGTTNGFSERPMVVKELYWVQHLFDGVIRVGAGRAEPENLVGGHKLQSANTFFLNKAFSGNPAIAYPGSGLAAAGALRPNDQWYVSAGAANAYGQTNQAQIDSLFEEWDLFSFVEAGWTPKFEGAGGDGGGGQGRYRVALWRIDERSRGSASVPEDSGISLIADQDFGERWKVFARAAWSDADATGV
ncbi:MAG: carbohydrate porin, partial [Phycisphaerales bacterium]